MFEYPYTFHPSRGMKGGPLTPHTSHLIPYTPHTLTSFQPFQEFGVYRVAYSKKFRANIYTDYGDRGKPLSSPTYIFAVYTENKRYFPEINFKDKNFKRIYK